jgi:hypothetical protein
MNCEDVPEIVQSEIVHLGQSTMSASAFEEQTSGNLVSKFKEINVSGEKEEAT